MGVEPNRSPGHTNLSTYAQQGTVKSYRGFDELFPAERYIFEKFDRLFRADVLDIAVGIGRTTGYLLPISRSYVGIDFSLGMVAETRVRFPGADVRQLDMRDIPKTLAGRTFDAILISFNGIDYIAYAERNRLLASLRGLLNPGGVLAFSTHDRSVAALERGFRIRPDLRPQMSLLRSAPAEWLTRLIKAPLWTAKTLPRYWRNRKFEQQFDDYAYINDIGENYGLITTYVSTQAQVDTLRSCGFCDIEVLHPWGDIRASAFNYFVCVSG